jgi:RNA recognition motif-containing protein
MAKHIYVGNLPLDTTADDLLALFQQYGTGGRSLRSG